MYLVDTDVLIWILRGNKKYEDLLQDLKYKGSVAISTITIAEVYKNIFPEEVIKTERVLEELESVDVTPLIAKQAGLYWQQHARNLKNLSIMDCLIAATANINEAVLVTLNVKHFPMKDIAILNPDHF